MRGYVTDIERESRENTFFRRVLFTSGREQLVVMSLQPGEDIGMEVHEETDQFIRVESGEGKAILDGEEFPLADGSAVVIPAKTWHDIVNTSSSQPLKLYTVYSPPEHADGTVHRTKAEAAAAHAGRH
jgi:mannose-6-phosphate isomerase-like protein (cupin superfamily)